MKRHETQVLRAALVAHQPLPSLQTIVQDLQQAAEISNISGLGFGFGVQDSPVEDVSQQRALRRDLVLEPLLHHGMLFQKREGEVLRRVVLGQDIIRDGTKLYHLFCFPVSAHGVRVIDIG